MKLPFAEQAIVSAEKLKNYLLSPAHPTGVHKARVFASIGYTRRNWREFRGALKEIARNEDADRLVDDVHGQKFLIRGILQGPTGRSLSVVTVWIYAEANIFRAS